MTLRLSVQLDRRVYTAALESNSTWSSRTWTNATPSRRSSGPSAPAAAGSSTTPISAPSRRSSGPAPWRRRGRRRRLSPRHRGGVRAPAPRRRRDRRRRLSPRHRGGVRSPAPWRRRGGLVPSFYNLTRVNRTNLSVESGVTMAPGHYGGPRKPPRMLSPTNVWRRIVPCERVRRKGSGKLGRKAGF